MSKFQLSILDLTLHQAFGEDCDGFLDLIRFEASRKYNLDEGLRKPSLLLINECRDAQEKSFDLCTCYNFLEKGLFEFFVSQWLLQVENYER